jgi:hypothetical protein
MKERRTNLTKRERFEALRASLLQRLRDVTKGMSPCDVDRMIAAMTRLKLKYEPWTALPEQDGNGRDPLSA